MRHAVLGLDLNALRARDPGFGQDVPFGPVVPLGLGPRRRRPVLDAILLHAVLLLDVRVASGRVAVPGQDRLVRTRVALPVLGAVAAPGLGAMFVLARWGAPSRDAAFALDAVLVLAPVARIGAC